MNLKVATGFWEQLLMGEEEWSFLPETVLRTVLMFIVILVTLWLSGKRGIKQLSIFELVFIIGLGSAAGDPMIYKSVGIVPALIVFVLVVILYRSITYLVGKNKQFEKITEGEPIYLIKDGAFSLPNFEKEALGEEEFFAELRLTGVSQLGQVKQAILEVSGNISVFFFPDSEVKHGLPIMPGSLEKEVAEIPRRAHYSCIFCGYTKMLAANKKHRCPVCDKGNWVPSSDEKRVR
ncbi:MAG TPA: YetF domain-containing protein [Fluviicola sp.]|nr:YetF domain-containing protein [Fluviicola sp.]